MHAADGAPMLRKRPALNASRKSAPPRAAALAVMPVPMAAPSRKWPRASMVVRFMDTRVPSGFAALILIRLAVMLIRGSRGRARRLRVIAPRRCPIVAARNAQRKCNVHSMDYRYPILLNRRAAHDCGDTF